MATSLILEFVLSVLLVATLAYCALLERKLSSLRKGQDGLKKTIADLNIAITAADASMKALKSNNADLTRQLEDRIVRGRSLADELSVLTASGERIAARIERAAPRNATHLTPAMTNRLHNLRPQLAGNVR